jgi:cytochrome c-type biogenesis protein CcmH/NrfG
MAKSTGSTNTSNATWTSTQAYVLAIICLLVGVAVGYLVKGSAAPQTDANTTQTAGAPAMPPGMGMEQQPTAADLKRMADTQAAPLLARLKSEPSNPQLLAQIGNLYYDAQQYKDAIDYYTRVLAIQPGNPDVRTDMGTAYYYLGDPDRAIQEFQTVLKSDPKHGQTLFNLGMVQWQGKGDAQAAVAAWENLLKVVPDYPDRAKVQELITRAKEHTKIPPGTRTDKPATM